MARTCDRVDCDAPYEVLVGWIPAASRTRDDDDSATVDRSWFYGCRVHAREAWAMFDRIGAAPVYRLRRGETPSRQPGRDRL